MKFVLLIAAFVFPVLVFSQDFASHEDFEFPRIKQSAAKPEGFIPSNWKLIGKAAGDLNGDGREDAAIALQATDKKYIREIEWRSEPFDTNPRILLILFREGAGYRLAERSNSFIVSSNAPGMMEPFQGMEVKRGVLQLIFEISYSAGSWYSSTTSYKFRFMGGAFKLIGADRAERMRNSGEITISSYNFLTNKLKVSTGEIDNDREKTTWTKFRPRGLRGFNTFKQPFTWDLIQKNNPL